MDDVPTTPGLSPHLLLLGGSGITKSMSFSATVPSSAVVAALPSSWHRMRRRKPPHRLKARLKPPKDLF
uniref:Uncharacterized protein n=1 Tax=Oryza sativa subsp. japonica TaxID=39947 RepID=Q69QB9_ORYSJ|nr:hypothetical protein [Oryza sativa Japonica Group]